MLTRNAILCKIVVLAVALYLFAMPLMAVFVQPQQAALAASNWSGGSRQVASIYSYQQGAFSLAQSSYDPDAALLPALYLLINNNGSYTLMSAEDNSLPVLAYSDTEQISLSALPPSFLEWADVYQNQINEIRTNRVTLGEYQSQWAALLSGSVASDRDPSRAVSPLLAVMWNQDWPYNALCPVDEAGPGGRVYAGCVATAMGMVMKYWNHPNTGEGNHSYYAPGYGYQSANFGATTYQWDQMGNSAGTNYMPVATLLYHCGVAVNMNYAPDGSGAQSTAAASAMSEYFRYPNAQYKSRDDYTAANWNALMKAQIDNGSPMYYSGSGSGGGHAFVLDGYDTADYFHFNFGWGGSSNGYFYTNNINPGGSDFNSWQSAIINTIPANYSVATIPVQLSAPNATVGDNFTVKLSTYPILGSWNISHYDMQLYYDHTSVLFTGFSIDGTISAGGDITVTENEPGVLSVNWNRSVNLAGGGDIIKFNFTPQEQGDYLFDLLALNFNTSPVTNTNFVMVNATAPVANLTESQISLTNIMHIGYQVIGTSSMSTTYLLPSWNVTHYQFNINFNPEKLEYVGIETAATLSEGLSPSASITAPGVLSISCDSETKLTGAGILLKLKFRAIGNGPSISITQLGTTDFYFNDTLITNTGSANVILSAYSANEDELAVIAPRLDIYPNPLSSAASFKFSSSSNNNASFAIYNLKGQLVRQYLVTEPAKTELMWDAKDANGVNVAAGVYLVRWQQGKDQGNSKVLVLK